MSRSGSTVRWLVKRRGSIRHSSSNSVYISSGSRSHNITQNGASNVHTDNDPSGSNYFRRDSTLCVRNAKFSDESQHNGFHHHAAAGSATNVDESNTDVNNYERAFDSAVVGRRSFFSSLVLRHYRRFRGE